jgi:hypothetical protein
VPVSAFIAETFDGRCAEKLERYTETSRGSSERERGHIEADGGADTKTTTKMRKRKIKRKQKCNQDPHVAQRAPKKGILV